jgi:hypothetical protein
MAHADGRPALADDMLVEILARAQPEPEPEPTGGESLITEKAGGFGKLNIPDEQVGRRLLAHHRVAKRTHRRPPIWSLRLVGDWRAALAATRSRR